MGVIFQLTQAPSETESTLGVKVNIFLGEVLVGHAVGNETDTMLPHSEARAQQNVAMLPWDQLAPTEPLKVQHQERETPDRDVGDVLCAHPASYFPCFGSGARCWTTLLTDSFMNQLPSVSTVWLQRAELQAMPTCTFFLSRGCKLCVSGALFLFCFSCLWGV